MSLRLTIELDPILENALQRASVDPSRALVEALALALFQQGEITHIELGGVLGLDRFETKTLLRRHHVFEESLTAADVDSDRKTLEAILGPVRSSPSPPGG
ncbi:MAG: UPF0175 family protein [Limisphaerales bacterium]